MIAISYCEFQVKCLIPLNIQLDSYLGTPDGLFYFPHGVHDSSMLNVHLEVNFSYDSIASTRPKYDLRFPPEWEQIKENFMVCMVCKLIR
jgi:hypothetical protein